jgi:mRNA interferase MazF
VLIVQANAFNDSRIQTVIVAAVTSNVLLAKAPGNVLLETKGSGLAKDSVVNVSQVLTIDKRLLTDRVGSISSALMAAVDAGLRLALQL